MNSIYVDFDAFDMQLKIKLLNNESIVEKEYLLQMEYIFLMDKEVYSFENENVYLEYFFAYTLNEKGNHYLNGEKFNIKDMQEKNVLSLIDEMFIVKDNLSRVMLQTENDFSKFYYLLEKNINDDFQGALKLEKYF